MIKKIYSYTLAPNQLLNFLSLQKKVDALYSKHLDYKVEFIQSLDNPDHIIEIQSYKNLKEAQKAEDLYDREPQLKKHYQTFLSMLVPGGELDEIKGEELKFD